MDFLIKETKMFVSLTLVVARSSIDKLLTNFENQETIQLIEKAEKDKLSATETARDKGLSEDLKKGRQERLAECLDKGLAK